MSIEDFSNLELAAEITRRGFKLHIDSVEVSVYLGDVEIGEVSAI